MCRQQLTQNAERKYYKLRDSFDVEHQNLIHRRCGFKTSIFAENDFLIAHKTVNSCAHCVKMSYS